VGVGHGPDDERPPAHPQQILQQLRAVGQEVHPVSYLLAEIQELDHEAVQRPTQCGRAGKQRDRTTPYILTHVLQIVPQLK